MTVAQGAIELDGQHAHAHKHVEAVKAGEHKEGGAIDAGIQGQAEIGVGFVIFRRLQEQKEHRQRDGDRQPAIEGLAVSGEQTRVRHVHGGGGRKQNRRVPHRQPGVPVRRVGEGHAGLGAREGAVVGHHLAAGPAHRFLRRGHHRPGELKPLPEQKVHAPAFALGGQPRPGQVAHVEQGAKEGRKEHHLREDEPEHAEHIGLLELAAGHTGDVFAHRGAKPHEQRGGKHQQAAVQDARRGLFGIAEGPLVHKTGRAKNAQHQTDRGQYGQRAAFGHVVFFVLA